MPSPDTSASPHRPAFASAALAIALYAVSLFGTFIYDDRAILELDPRLRDPALWSKYLTESYNGGAERLYRPLVSATYVLQWQLHGDRPMPYHAANVLLHAGASALVAALAFRWAGNRAAYIAGLLFAAHPIHVEAVANVVGRAELMCASGFLGAMLLFTRPLTVGRAWGIWGCCMVAILSKEQGLFAPVVLLAMWWARRWTHTERHVVDPQSPAERAGARAMLLLLCWTVSAYVVFRESVLPFHWDRYFLDWTINPLKLSAGTDRWLMPLMLLGRYTQLLFFPWRLSPDYGARVIGWQAQLIDPYLYLGSVALVTATALLVISVARRKATPMICLLALGLTYGLVSNMASIIGINLAERLMYLPSAFLILLFAWAVRDLPARRVVPALCIVLALAGWRTVSYAARWNDRTAFYERSLAEQPRSVRLAMLLADDLNQRGDHDRAAQVAAQACEIEPDYLDAWLLRAYIATDRRQWDEAQHYIARANAIEPGPRVVAYADRLARLRAEDPASSQPATTLTRE